MLLTKYITNVTNFQKLELDILSSLSTDVISSKYNKFNILMIYENNKELLPIVSIIFIP